MIQENYYNNYTSGTEITPDSPEFNKDELYSDLGEISSSDVETITINNTAYTTAIKDFSIGNNAHIKAPVFTIEDGHLLVSTLHLALEAEDGLSTVKAGNNTYNVTLSGLDSGDTLTVKEIKGVNTQPGRKNEVTVDGSVVTQVSNNGNHMVAVTLEADGQVIDDPNEVVYTLQVNGNIGMTAPEAFGNDGVYYTYGIYTKYKNGDYTAADAGIRNITKTIIVPGKGRVDLKFVLHAEEYKAE